MYGSVAEWTQDCWHDSYEGAPNDGSAWVNGDCSIRVIRGGSGSNAPNFMRSASRNKNTTTVKNIITGFRIVRFN